MSLPFEQQQILDHSAAIIQAAEWPSSQPDCTREILWFDSNPRSFDMYILRQQGERHGRVARAIKPTGYHVLRLSAQRENMTSPAGWHTLDAYVIRENEGLVGMSTQPVIREQVGAELYPQALEAASKGDVIQPAAITDLASILETGKQATPLYPDTMQILDALFNGMAQQQNP